MTLACDNPFRADRFHGLAYRWLDGDCDAFMRRLAAVGRRGAIVGPHGSGKTTLMRESAARLEQMGYRAHYLFLNDRQLRFNAEFDAAFFGRLDERDFLLLDGCEALNAVRWRWFLWRARGAGGLLVTTHCAGRLPTVYETRTTMALLDELYVELDDSGDGSLRGEAARLFVERGGNLREVWFGLYDILAQGG